MRRGTGEEMGMEGQGFCALFSVERVMLDRRIDRDIIVRLKGVGGILRSKGFERSWDSGAVRTRDLLKR